MSEEVLTDVKAIMTFFKSTEKPLTLQELKELNPDDRKDLGQLCREALEQ